MSDEIIKRYTGDGITIVWKPSACIHSTRCFQGLPGVFNPARRPWVDLAAADLEAIVRQVGECPSGALSVERADAPKPTPAHVELLKNGPLLLRGEFNLDSWDGTRTPLSGVTALCRCGASQRKPFCDGSHGPCGFEG